MRPIRFACSQRIAQSAPAICAEIADVARWREFKGYGLLPGIADAVYEQRTETMIGSRVRVRNTDGSGHVEEFYAWEPTKQVAMKFDDFTPPLHYLATHFTEEWYFEPQTGGTLVTRKFQLFPKHAAARPVLWLISLVFRRAIARHLAEMARAASGEHREQ